MMKVLLLNFAFGLTAGYVLELAYTSIEKHRLVWPLAGNVVLYGLATGLLYLISTMMMPTIPRFVLIALLPTLLEFILGYAYLTIGGVPLWDYSRYAFNYHGLICLQFSLAWALMALAYCYFFIPTFSRM